MRHIACVALLVAAAACRGNEPIPRDYQNNPPAMTHPVTSSSDTPTAHGMPGAAPEPSKGVEGENVPRQPESATSPTHTLGNQAPATTDSQHETQTGGRAVTGTHLAAPP